ncbi:TolC family protein [Odoribacter laneus]|uniref:TolC family protein n=1 Tax=Odoribacter laneus TaxID=626933 RepID=UPI00189B2228|nr:TolC family protein [Odoribacter laneus]
MIRVFFCTVLLLSGLSIKAQTGFSLQDCRNLAIENNKRLKIADEEILAGLAQKEEAFTKYLPGVDATGVYMRNQKKIHLLEQDAYLPVGAIQDGTWKPRPDQVQIVNGQPVPKDYALLPKEAMTVDDRNTALLQLGLTQAVYMGGKIRAYNHLAGLSLQLAYSKRELELQNVIETADEAYWQVVSLINRKKLAEKYVEALKKFEHDIDLMYKTGLSTKADVLSVRVKLNEAEMQQLRVEDGLSLSRMRLNQVCGLSTDTIFPLRDENIEGNGLPNIEQLPLEQVYAKRPEVIGLELATQMYKKKEKIALSQYLPTVALTANYLTMAPSFFDGISTKFDGMWSVGIGVKAPIFHWGASRKSLRNARAQTGIMEYRLLEAKEQIELQVRQSEFKIKEVAKKLEMAGNNLERADENLKLANLGFQEGTIPVSNVLEAQAAWLSAHAELIDSRIEMKLCEVYLQKAYGILGQEN